MTITWKIETCDRNTSDGFITVAHWRATAVDEGYSASIYSTCSFPAGTPAVPYADVTEADVLGWCWANGVDKDAIEAQLVQQIEAQKHPTTAAGTPWSNQ